MPNATIVRVYLAPAAILSAISFPPDNMSQWDLIEENFNRYLMLPPITLDVDEDLVSGEAASEEVFDLTNNPSRQEERIQRYGNGRSLSVGDVVEFGGRRWACLSVGWHEL